MDYKILTNKLQSRIDRKIDRHFYKDLLSIAKSLENSDDVKVFRVAVRYKKLLSDFEDPFDWRKFDFRDPNAQNDIVDLTIKLIDYLNDYFGFLKPLQ